MTQASLEQRVVRAAEAALAEHGFVAPIDVLISIGWLAPVHVDIWRQGRVADLETLAQANLSKRSEAVGLLRRWATARGLSARETVYVARTRDRHPLRFSRSGKPEVERGYRTHWLSPALPVSQRERIAERESRPADLVVISPLNREWTCRECSGTGDLLIMDGPGPLCMTCAEMDHLVYLPSGDAALTRRAKKESRLSAVVIRFSRARKRYERQGILIEEAALQRAESECLADEEARTRRRAREELRRADQDLAFQSELAGEILRVFPGCTRERADAIARHTGARGSGRVGRSAAARSLDPDAVTLAVVASVRHKDTGYDSLLMRGVPREVARDRVRAELDQILARWREPGLG